MPTRKKWRTVYPGNPDDVDVFPSQQKTYEWVESMRSSWAAGAPGSAGTLTVQVDEGLGAGWEYYEFINFAEEAA